MPYDVRRNGTFLIPSGTSRDLNRHHLGVIATPPCMNGKCLVLSVSSIKQGVWHDPSCEIPAGVHEFISHPSFVSYRHATIVNCEHIEKCIEGWVYHAKGVMPVEWTDRMLEGAFTSDMTPRFVLNYLDTLDT